MRDFFAKTSKLLVSLLLVLSLVLTLSACGKSDDEINLDAAYDALILGDTGAVEADLDLFTAGMNGSTITWASSDEDVIATDGTVTRPAVGEGNATVTLTATITIGEYSRTKEFTVTVIEAVESNVADSIADLHANSSLDDAVEITGIVYFLTDGGYFITDGTYGLSIYASDLEGQIGDEVTITGEYAVYNTTYQISGTVTETINSSGNAITIPSTTLTVAEALALDSSDRLIAGKLFTITGLLTVEGSYNNLYLNDGDDKIMINYYSLPAALDALETFAGQVVTIEVSYYTNHGTNGPMLSFQGTAADVTVATLTDAEKVANIGTWLATQIPASTTQDITLPNTDANYGSTITWATSDAAHLTDAGVATLPMDADVDVTLTATVDVNGTTDTFDFVVTVKADLPSTIADVLANNEADDEIYIQGVVFGSFYYGYYVNDGTGNMYVYVGADGEKPAVGTEVKLVGTYDIYYGQPELTALSSVQVVSTGNATLEATASTIADIIAFDTADLTFFGSYLTITGTVVVVDGDVFIQDDLGNEVFVYYRSNADAVAAFDGQEITLDIIFYTFYSSDTTWRVLFVGEEADITPATLTDAEKLEAAKTALVLPTEVVGDMTLPTVGAYDAAITWASSDETVIALDGTVATVTEDTVVTLTATIDVNGTVGNKVFTITVLAATPMTVAEIFALADDEMVVFEGLVTGMSNNAYWVTDGTDFIQVYVGSAPTVAIGDIVFLVGARDTYTVPEIVSLTTETVVSSGNALPTPVVMTLQELVDYADNADPTTIGVLVEVAGEADIQGTYDNAYLTDGTNNIEIYYRSNGDAQDLIKALDGLQVTVVATVYNGNVQLIVSAFEDVTTSATDTEIGTAIGAYLLNEMVTEAALGDLVELPATLTLFPAAAITWASGDETVIALDGTVGVVDVDTDVTLTASIDVNGTVVTQDVVITVLAPTPMTVAEIFALADEELVVFEGLVTGMSNNAYWVTDGTDFIQVYTGSAPTVAIGDIVFLVGERDTYTVPEIVSLTTETVVSSGNALPTPVVMTLQELVDYADNADPTTIGVLVELTGEADIQGSYNNAYLTDGTNNIEIYYRSNSDAQDLIKAFDGFQVTVVATVYNGNVQLIVSAFEDVTVTATDAEFAQATLAWALAQVETEFTESGTITIPATWPLVAGATIAWTSSNDLAIDPTTGAVVVTAEVNETVTLTATVTYGLETAQGTVDVDLIGIIPLSTVAETWALSDGDVVKVQGVITAIMEDNTLAIEDPDGTAIIVSNYNSTADYTGLAIGDLVTIIGFRGFYKVDNVEIISSITIESSGNAVTDPIAVTDLAAFRLDADPTKAGKRFTFTDVVTVDTSYYQEFYNDGGDPYNRMGIVMSYSTSLFDWDSVVTGDLITFTALLYTVQNSDIPDDGYWRFSVNDPADITVTPAP